MSAQEISIIAPTYKEAANLPALIQRIKSISHLFEKLELLLMDDNSQDGTEEFIQRLNLPWIRLTIRKENRGLSPAVLEGLRLAELPTLCVMDADLSHPPEAIPHMVEMLYRDNCDFVVGSRYTKGGQVEKGWGFFRTLNSKIATLLARPFTRISDPMSGFFCLKRSTFEQATHLNPIGYKIGLELIVKCRSKKVCEVPIQFIDRKKGSSKLTWRQQTHYIRHIKRLADYKFGNASFAVQFLIVGATGTVVNLLLLSVFLIFLIPLKLALALAILFSMSSNFLLNRWITFRYALEAPAGKQYMSFVLACSTGALINYYTTLTLIHHFSLMAYPPQLSALIGIAAGTLFNFLTSRYWAFKNPNEKNYF